MEMKIFWTIESRNRLKDIYDYYLFNASENVAQKLISEIIDYADILKRKPLIGQKEEALKHRKKDYHYLLYKNYKIIYWAVL